MYHASMLPAVTASEPSCRDSASCPLQGGYKGGGVPKITGILLGVPIIRTIVFWGYIGVPATLEGPN